MFNRELQAARKAFANSILNEEIRRHNSTGRHKSGTVIGVTAMGTESRLEVLE